jgi:hypothetical protein
MAQIKRYLIPGLDDNPEYCIEQTMVDGKDGFYGAHGAGKIIGAYFTIEKAEEALLAEIKKRAVKESVQVTKRAADLAKLAFDLSNTGFKGYRADP